MYKTSVEAKPAKKEKLAPLSERLRKLGLVSDWDFVLHLPLRYEDETKINSASSLYDGRHAQVQGKIVDRRTIQTSKGQQFIAVLEDETGRVSLRFIYFYSSTLKSLALGAVVRASGEVRRAFGGGLEIVHPKIRAPLSNSDELPKSLTPVYPLGESIQQKWMRNRIDRALLDLNITDYLPDSIRIPLGLPGLKESLLHLHHPPVDASEAALSDRTDAHWRRLKFDELLAQQITLKNARARACRDKAPAIHPADDALSRRFIDMLPFKLTNAQKRVVDEISRDLMKEVPMRRLVQGDVGSGKTVVAALAALKAVQAGRQVALMAPTEILAEQHFQKISAWMQPLGVRTVWLSGSQKAAHKRESLAALATGEASIAVGTHALIQDSVKFADLGLAIVDEQHRFGVRQRLNLKTADDSIRPHLLMLSATPIPRTLAMSYLADMDVSVIDELPPGRTPIVTKTIRISRRDAVVSAIASNLSRGEQAYWVCPLIEDSEALDLASAVRTAELLQKQLPGFKVGLVHSGIASSEKDSIMKAFAANEVQLLVATTVIEVGVDVPNASIMVIEHAERFGLAQLHQLRGRVGRGALQSACILLFDDDVSDAAAQRIRIMKETTDGFEIARKDLEMRGPGEFLGERQSGMPMLRFADLEADEGLLRAAQEAADALLASDPDAALAIADRWFSTKMNYLSA